MKTVIAAAAVALIGLGALSSANAKHSGAQNQISDDTIQEFIQTYDPDRDGTVSPEEMNKAAEARFGILDADHDGTVDQKEIAPVGISDQDFTKFDGDDKDKKLQENEYMAMVEQRFEAANPSQKEELGEDDLKSEAGQDLMRLVQ